jgi:hypothetical protein
MMYTELQNGERAWSLAGLRQLEEVGEDRRGVFHIVSVALCEAIPEEYKLEGSTYLIEPLYLAVTQRGNLLICKLGQEEPLERVTDPLQIFERMRHHWYEQNPSNNT